MSARIGRPPSDNPRRNAISIRLTDDELSWVQAAAGRAELTVGEWARTKVVAAGKRGRRPHIVDRSA